MRKIIYILAITLFTIQSENVLAQCSRPVVSSFSPVTGYIGSNVTISGSDFDPIPSNNKVFFGATMATILSGNSFSLVVKVPIGATYSPITVKNGCGLIGLSKIPFNGIFCEATLSTTSYNTVSYSQSVSGGYQMLSQDMDLDGKPDLLVTGFTTNTISIVRNLSTPGTVSFASEQTFSTPSNTRCIAPGDFDGDGKVDLAVTSNGYGIYIYRNLSSPGTISMGSPLGLDGSFLGTSGTYQMASGDLNNDGKLDLVFSDFSGNVYTLLNTSSVGNISFSKNTVINNTYGTTGIAISDIDGDGLADIITSCPNNDFVSAIRNTTGTSNTTFSFASPQFFNTNSSYPYRAFVGDFDKDGKMDIVTNNYSGAKVSIFRNTSSSGTISMASTVNISSPTSNYRIVVGDVNGDGFPDIATKSSGENLFSVYKNTSSGAGNIAFATRIDYSGQAEVSGIVVGDLDGDYVPDIATSGISNNQLRVHRNTSSITDNTNPTASCKNITVYLDNSGNATISASDIDNGSSDACGISSMTINKSSFTCANIGDNSVILTVTDNYNNQASCTATVKVVALQTNGVTTFCSGGSLVLTAVSGSSYLWSTNETTQAITVTQSGTYTVEITGGAQCSNKITSSITVTVLQTPQSFNVTGGGVNCGNNSGVHIGLSGSQTGVIYRLKLGSVYLNNIEGNGSAIDFGVYATGGTYQVEAVNIASGCGNSVTMSGTATVTAQANPSFTITASSTKICSGNSVTLSTSASGPSWEWTPGSSTNSSISVSPNTTTTYSLKGTDNLGCNSTQTVTITVNPKPTVSAGNDVTFCSGGAQLTSNITDSSFSGTEEKVYLIALQNLFNASSSCASGSYYNGCGTAEPGFTWQDQGTFTVTNVKVEFSIGVECHSNVSHTTKLNSLSGNNFTANYNCNCSGSTNSPFTINFSNPSGYKLGGSNSFRIGNNNTCLGYILSSSLQNSFARVTVTYGKSPTYSWSPSTGLSSASIANPVASPANTTTYTLNYTSSEGCSASDEVVVTKQCCITPTIACPSNISVNNSTGLCGANVTFEATSTGTSPTITYSPASGSFFAVGTTTVTATAANSCGTDVCTFDVTVTDTENPVITCPNDIIVNNDAGKCAATITITDATATDNCAVQTIVGIRSDALALTADYPVGTTTIIWKVTDNSSNTDVCTQTITVNDTEKPNALCKNKTIQLDNSETATITVNDVDNGSSDACGIKSLSISKSSFNCSNFGANYLTLTVTDNNNNVSTCQDTITILRDLVFDYSITSPVEECSKVTIKWHGGCTSWNVNIALIDSAAYTVQTYAASNIANSGSYTWTLPSCIPAGRYYFYIEEVSRTTTWTYGTSVFTINNTAPTITTQASDAIVECDGHGNTSALTAWLASNGGATATDACGNLTWTNNFSALSDLCGATGSATVIFTVKDACGNPSTTTATFTIEDKTAPTITTSTGSLDANLECSDASGIASALAAGPSASDNCTSNPTRSLITDNTYNTITTTGFTGSYAPSNWSLIKTSGSSGSVNTASAPNSIQLNGSDGGGGGTKDTRYQISVPTAGTITFSWSYVTSDRDGPRYDPFGYYLNGTFVQLTNNGGANNQSGTKSISVSANDNFAFYIRSTDNVLGASTTVASNFTAVTQLCSNEYIRVRTWNFKDDCNNTSAFFTQTIHVKDNTAPVINTQASNSTVDCDGAGNTSTLNAWLANHGGAVATDACGGVTWSHNFTNLSNDCGATGSATVTFTVKDACGNKSTTTATFTIEDKTAPTIGTDAANSTVECDGSGNTSALNAWLASNGGASASDDCGGVTWSHNFTNLSDDCGATGSAEVTFTVKDACGNKSTTTATFTIVDKTAPIAICKAATITLVNGAASITADDINNGSYDVCSGGVTISASKTSFDCTNIGANTVTLTVTDACGNTSTCDATVTVVGKIPTLSISQGVQPVFCQGGAVVLSSSSNETVTYAWSNNATTANTSVYSSGTYSLTVTNSYGCTKSASTTVAYSQTDLLSSYTVLVTDEAEIEKESVVKSGGVGSTGTKGEVEVNESSLITASGTFAKAYEVEVKSGSSVTNAYSGTAVSVTLPTFAYNPYCDSKCSSKYHHHCSSSCSNNEHYHCKSSCNSSSHKHCSSSKCNYRDDVKVKKGATVTITDSIFKKIHIESDATVTFTSKNIYADEIETQKNVTIKFSGCTRIFLCKELKIHEDNVFNSANNSVIIYAEKKVDIKKGTTMNANVYTLEHFDTKGDKKSRNTLTGMYIAEKVHAHYTDFNWNTVCGSCGTMGKKSLEADLDGLRDASVDYVNVYPNPTNGLTTVSVSANSEAILKVKVINIAGEMLYSTEKTDFRGLAEIQIDMTTYAVGMYFIKVEYGNTTKIFKVNRLN